MATKVRRKTSENHFFEVTTQKRPAKFHDNILGKFGKIWAKIRCIPKNLLASTPMAVIHNSNICRLNILLRIRYTYFCTAITLPVIAK